MNESSIAESFHPIFVVSKSNIASYKTSNFLMCSQTEHLPIAINRYKVSIRNCFRKYYLKLLLKIRL